MQTCLKVLVMVLLAVALAAGAALAGPCGSSDCLFPGLEEELIAWLPVPPEAMVLACSGGDCGNSPVIEGSGAKDKQKPGMQLACEVQPCRNHPDLEGSTPAAAGGNKNSQPGMMLACDGPNCPHHPDFEGATPAAAGGKGQQKPGIQLACDSQPCWHHPDHEGATPAAAGSKGQAQPGVQLACMGENCLYPGPQDERVAALTPAQRQLLLCIAEVCGLVHGLDATILSCDPGANCFAPVPEAEGSAVR